VGAKLSPGAALARQRWDNRPALPPPTTLGGRIRHARLKKKWTLAKLAKKTGISKNTLTQYELDLYRAPADRLEIIAKALDVTVAVLTDGLK
jgi:transcriptional regulator with XRE-family HTH domain